MKDCNSNNAKPEQVPDMVCSSRYGGFKKKGGNNNTLGEVNSFKGLGFHIGKDEPKIYEKTINKLALSTSTQFKNIIFCTSLTGIDLANSSKKKKMTYRKMILFQKPWLTCAEY